MTPFRWTLLTAVVLGLGAMGLHRAWQDPAPPAAARPETPALALAPPAPAASAGALPAAVPLPVAASAASAAAAAPRIGSEGYGPHIERAQASGDAAQAWEAVRWLRQCATNEARRGSFETLRNQGISPEMMTQLMVETDADTRRCQTVTAQHRALLPELATRAMRAGVPEAASAYAGEVFAGDLTPAQRQEVADAMRRDARAGDAPSLLGAALANEAWGLSDTERLTFLAAYGELPTVQDHDRAHVKALLAHGRIRFSALPTAEQQAAARLAAQQIVDQARSRSGGRP